MLHRVFLVSAALITALPVVASGCGGARDKAGGPRPTTLTLDAPDEAGRSTDVFVREAERHSHGTLRIVLDTHTYSSQDPANEGRLAEALRTGRAELALVASRAWESQGVTTFRALQAPFLVTGYGLLRQIVTGPVGTEILRGTDRIGVLGLTLVPDELRRTLGRRPLTTPDSLQGARIQILASATTAATLRALGAIPRVDSLARVDPGFAQGSLDGVESSAGLILRNNFQAFAHYLPANLVLFPKTFTIAIRRRTFRRLAPEQQRALRAAAAATQADSLNPAPTEVAHLEQLCRVGVRLVRSTSADLAALRAKEEPVYRMLRRDPATAKLLGEIERLKAATPNDAAPVPARCEPTPTITTGSTASPLPEGKYVTTLTAADFGRVGGNSAHPEETWTITLRNGRFREVLTPTRPEQPPGYGIYTVRGDTVTFFFQSPMQMPGVRETVRWSYYRGDLSFEVVSVADPDGVVFYTAHPWHRVG